MELIKYGFDYAEIKLSVDELLSIGNAITDVFNAVRDNEILPRIGGSCDQIRQLSEEIKNVLRQMG